MAFNLENTHTPAHNQLKKWDVDRMLKKEITLFGNSFKNKKKEAKDFLKRKQMKLEAENFGLGIYDM